jgi:NAD(P)-dependent dehydrogenase (short-subunit alcohol dehydrogenase family)
MNSNSVAIVTGASQGIGRATAVRLARDFSAIVLASRNQDELQTAAAAVCAAGANAAIIALAKAFAEQGIKDGVQVNSVVPGAVMTGRRESFFKKWAPAHNLTVEEAVKKFPGEVGIARFGKPEEIADLMAYLVSRAAKWMTGSCMRMDGGEIKGI